MDKKRPAESELIDEILAFEETMLEECRRRLLPYEEQAKALGIELKLTLAQYRAKMSRSFASCTNLYPYHLKKKGALPNPPSYYYSAINITAFEDGKVLREFTDRRTATLYATRCTLLTATKDGMALEEDPPLKSLDQDVAELLSRVSQYLAARAAGERGENATSILATAAFLMPIDDLFPFFDAPQHAVLTGRIERGRIRPRAAVHIVDADGKVRYASTVSKIVSQDDMLKSKTRALFFASAYKAVGLVFEDVAILDHAGVDMYVVVQ